jgi:hypothetical protein
VEIKLGATYRTKAAIWTVEFISTDSMVRFRRDDGLTAWFGAKQFAEWVVERIS